MNFLDFSIPLYDTKKFNLFIQQIILFKLTTTEKEICNNLRSSFNIICLYLFYEGILLP